VIFQLRNSVSQGRQKTYLFECLELDELASLIECYSPSHVTWSTNGSAAHRPSWRISQVIGPSSAVDPSRSGALKGSKVGP